MAAENNNIDYPDDQVSKPLCYEELADPLEAKRHRWLAVHEGEALRSVEMHAIGYCFVLTHSRAWPSRSWHSRKRRTRLVLPTNAGVWRCSIELTEDHSTFGPTSGSLWSVPGA
jgi:hypothetical protein